MANVYTPKGVADELINMARRIAPAYVDEILPAKGTLDERVAAVERHLSMLDKSVGSLEGAFEEWSDRIAFLEQKVEQLMARADNAPDPDFDEIEEPSSQISARRLAATVHPDVVNALLAGKEIRVGLFGPEKTEVTMFPSWPRQKLEFEPDGTAKPLRFANSPYTGSIEVRYMAFYDGIRRLGDLIELPLGGYKVDQGMPVGISAPIDVNIGR